MLFPAVSFQNTSLRINAPLDAGGAPALPPAALEPPELEPPMPPAEAPPALVPPALVPPKLVAEPPTEPDVPLPPALFALAPAAPLRPARPAELAPAAPTAPPPPPADSRAGTPPDEQAGRARARAQTIRRAGFINPRWRRVEVHPRVPEIRGKASAITVVNRVAGRAEGVAFLLLLAVMGRVGSLGRAWWCAVAAPLLTACGGSFTPSPAGDGDPSALFSSGTRLKARYLDANDGARKLLGFHDRLLDVDCYFAETAVGQYHCLPARVTASFSDSACSAPVLPVLGSCPEEPELAASDLITAVSADCAALLRPYSLDALRTEVLEFNGSGTGDCYSASADSKSRPKWTAKAESITRFVAARPSVVGAAGGVQARRIIAEDGAFVTKELLVDGEPCSPIVIDGVTRCVPGPFANRFQQTTGDSTCSGVMGVADGALTRRDQCAGARTRYLFEAMGDGCSRGGTVFELGGPLNSVDLAGSCAVNTPPPDAKRLLYAVGASLPGSGFRELHTTRIGEGALTLGFFTDRARRPLVLESELAASGDWALADGAHCRIFIDAKGELRCVHDAFAMDSSSYFADATCSEPIYAVDAYCDRPPIAYLLEGVVGPCPFSVRAHSPRFTQAYVATAYSGSIYLIQSGECRAHSGSPSGRSFYAAGERVSADTFPLVHETSDL